MKGELGTSVLLAVGVLCLIIGNRQELPLWAACLFGFTGGFALFLAVRRIYRHGGGR